MVNFWKSKIIYELISFWRKGTLVLEDSKVTHTVHIFLKPECSKFNKLWLEVQSFFWYPCPSVILLLWLVKNKNYHKSVTNEEWFLFKMSGEKVQDISVDMYHRFSSLLELNAVASSLHVIFLHATNPPDHSMAATRLPTLLSPGPNPLREGKTHIILLNLKVFWLFSVWK